MRHPIRRSLAPLLVLACLAGCSGTPEDRINAAVPVARDVDTAHADIAGMAKEHAEAVKAVEDEYRGRLKVRALTCAAGFEPSLFADEESIRADVGNADCFAEQDARLAQWLGLRRVSLLLALPPLRPLPAKPIELVTGEEGMTDVAFARNAGVMAMQWKGHVRVVDLATGDAIHDEDTGFRGGLTLSDNGRVLAVGSEDLVQVRSAETGDVLLTIPEARMGYVQFLGERGLVFLRTRKSEIVVREFATGDETALPFEAFLLNGALPVAGKPDTFLLLSPRRLALLELHEREAPRLARELAIEGSGGGWGAASDGFAPGPDGKLYAAAGTGVKVIDPATLEDSVIPFEPMRITRVVPTPKADELLVTGSGGRSAATYLYSRSANTLAPVAPPDNAYGAATIRYVPSLRRNATVANLRMALVDIEAGAPQPAADVLDALAFDVAIAQSEQAALRERLLEQYGNRASTPAPTGADAARREVQRAEERARALVAQRDAERASAVPRSGKDGIVDALNSGVLRLGTVSDLDAWKRLYVSKTGRRINDTFDNFTRSQDIYIITREFTVPEGLTGSDSATFILERGAPYPRGRNQHSAILDMKSGGCTGNMCGFLLHDD
jgi:hypothetical protein